MDDDRFEELMGGLEIALGRDRSGEIVDRSKGFATVVAVQPAHPFDDTLLKLARLDQIALSGHRDRELADCFQRVEMLLTQGPTAPGDHLSLNLASRDEPAFGP